MIIEWIKEENQYEFASIYKKYKIGKIIVTNRYYRFRLYGTKTFFVSKILEELKEKVQTYINDHPKIISRLFPYVKNRGYFRYTKYEINEILPLIDSGNKKFKLENFNVNINSLRLQTFKHKGIKCVKCKIEGNFFALEKRELDKKPHLNLYAIDKEGKEILMTKDHIIPFSAIGEKGNHLDNMQTMCTNCNSEKGVRIEIYI